MHEGLGPSWLTCLNMATRVGGVREGHLSNKILSPFVLSWEGRSPRHAGMRTEDSVILFSGTKLVTRLGGKSLYLLGQLAGP